MTTLRIALEKVDFLPANRVTDDTSILTLKNLVMEPLCRWQDGVLEPALLSHWQHSQEGRHWRFEIRPEAKFHDGKPCRAEDILGFIEGILDSRDMFGKPWAYSRYFAGARFTAAGDNAFELDSVEPIGDVLEIFSEFYICRNDAQGLPLLGTGPYRVEQFDAGQQALLSAVVADVEPGRLVFVACADASQRYRLLGDGAVDVAANLERCHDRLDFDPRWVWQRQLNTLSVMHYLNCSEGLFRDPLARLAVNLAVDAQGIVDELFHGLGQASSTVVSPWHTGGRHSNAAPLVYAPERARLARSGGWQLRDRLAQPRIHAGKSLASDRTRAGCAATRGHSRAYRGAVGPA